MLVSRQFGRGAFHLVAVAVAHSGEVSHLVAVAVAHSEEVSHLVEVSGH